MRKAILLLFVFFTVSSVVGQSFISKPDYKKIEKNIKDKKSNLYFESLMNRFKNADSTMTLDEKQHLYYGFTFTKDYNPYDRSGILDTIFSKLNEPDTTKINYSDVLHLCNQHVAKSPFDLRIYNAMLYLNEKLDDKANFEKAAVKLRSVVDAIMQSGDGKTKETAYYVIYVTHEYDMISILGYEFGGEQRLIEHYDYLKLKENPSKIPGFYFDITPSLEYLNKKF